MLKQVPLLTHIGPCNSPKCLEMGNVETHFAIRGAWWECGAGGGGGGGFFHRKRGSRVSKTGFPKMTPNHLGCSNRWFLAIFGYLRLPRCWAHFASVHHVPSSTAQSQFSVLIRARARVGVGASLGVQSGEQRCGYRQPWAKISFTCLL